MPEDHTQKEECTEYNSVGDQLYKFKLVLYGMEQTLLKTQISPF